MARSRILRGIQLQRASLSWAHDEVATYRAKIAIDEDATLSDIRVDNTTSAAESQLLSWGFSRSAATASAQWDVLAQSGLSARPVEYVTARQVFSRMAVQTRFADLEPAPAFVEDVKQVLNKRSVEEQETALRQVLSSWGHVIPTYVEIGSAIGSTIDLSCIRGVSISSRSAIPHHQPAHCSILGPRHLCQERVAV